MPTVMVHSKEEKMGVETIKIVQKENYKICLAHMQNSIIQTDMRNMYEK